MELKWDDLRIFLAVHKSGSLKGAARLLHVDHSTVSRRMVALEDALGLSLFCRDSQGLLLTDSGHAVLPIALEIDEQVGRLKDLAQTHLQKSAAEVTIATSPILANDFLLPRLPQLKQKFPHLKFKANAATERADITKGDADLAIRTHPKGVAPADVSLHARPAGQFGFAVYASSRYLAQRGCPDLPITNLSGHAIVVASERGPGAKWNASLAKPASEVSVVFPYAATMAAVKSDLGLALLPCLMADRETGVQRVGDVLLHWDVWLISRMNVEEPVGAVCDVLAKMLKEGAAEISGLF